MKHLLSLLCIHIEKAAFRMIAALIQSITSELGITLNTVELNDTSEKLPEEVFPGNFLSSQGKNELVELKIFISNMR